MADPAATVQRRLVFLLGETRFELDADHVIEVIRTPFVTRVPHAPEALTGIANLRGRPLPVLSMKRLMGEGTELDGQAARIIVYQHSRQPIGLLVDAVLTLSTAAQAGSAEIVDLDQRIAAAFRTEDRGPLQRSVREPPAVADQTNDDVTRILSFRAGGQYYGLPLASVHEVAALSGEIAILPNSGGTDLGVVTLRDSVLPLVSLAALVGLTAENAAGAGSRIVVVESDGALVGLVVDAMDAIQSLSADAIEPVPAVLQRGRGEAEITAIGRVDGGRLLISILSPERLFGHASVRDAVTKTAGATTSMATIADIQGAQEQVLIFKLGDETYGLPIAAVDEVIRVPAEITRLPNAPDFVTGIVNLRGKAVALIDQRVRFQFDKSGLDTKARAIIVTIGTLQAGFIVDGVSEVVSIPQTAVSAAPDLAAEETEVFNRVAYLEDGGRMILLVDPKALLSRAEQDLVTSIATTKAVAADT
jgi:purine-binding chemotaxis protein CheW